MRASSVVTAFFTALVILPIVLYQVAWVGSERTVDTMVDERERIVTGSGQDLSSKYIVFTNAGEFEVTDTWLFFDFRSSSRYALMKKGYQCNVQVAGWRVGFLSMYPNVVKINECSEGAETKK